METVRDLNFWRSFLDMMADSRFNTLTLWNLHPYTFMIRPKNFPEASPFTYAELVDWQHFYHTLFRMAHERGIDTESVEICFNDLAILFFVKFGCGHYFNPRFGMLGIRVMPRSGRASAMCCRQGKTPTLWGSAL
jgi:hypothetical protein